MIVRRSYHAPFPSFVFAALTLLLAVGAFNSQNNLLFLAFGFAIGAYLVSGLVSGQMMMGLTATRELPEWGAVGEPLTLRYEVSNTNRFIPGFGVRVTEVESRSFLPSGAPQASWKSLMPAPRACVVHVGPRESVGVFATITPTRRGLAVFSGVRVSSSIPFGMFEKRISIERRRTIPILPRVARLRRDVTTALVARADTGASCAPARGAGEEFFGLREYTSGDSQRSVAWRASARLGTLVVREHTAPRAGSILVKLHFDSDALRPARQEIAEDAIVLAASLLADAMAQGMDAALAIPQATTLIPPGSGARHRFLLLSALAGVDVATCAGRVATDEAESAVARTAPGAVRVVVHAGAVDPSIGPPDARHLSSAEFALLTAESESAGDAGQERRHEI